MSPTTIFAGVVFGSVGFGYFIYGKKQARLVPLISGLLLFLTPYFISNIILLIVVGALLMAAPLLIKT